ncbi:bifunctional metallophosphatase/5'-nucleotidase, partial [Anaerotignum lactatifermentans]
MKHGKLWSAVLSAAMVMGTTVPILAADMDGKLVVIHTNDIHGYYATAEESVGIAGVAALKDYYEAQGADVVLLDAGDFSQGTTLVNHSNGLKAAEYLAAADYDAVSLGNHEFDFGFEALKDTAAVLKAADIPIIDANVLKKGTDTPYFEANTIVETDGMKVGIFGLDTAETRTKSSPSSVKDLTFLDGQEMFDCAQAQVDALEAEGCDYIIALTHLGVDEESTGRRSTDLAEAVDGIDLIVDGHSHTVMDGGQMVGDTMIVSTGSYLANVGTVVVDKATGEETAKLISAADYAANYGTYDENLAKMVAADQAEV